MVVMPLNTPHLNEKRKMLSDTEVMQPKSCNRK